MKGSGILFNYLQVLLFLRKICGISSKFLAGRLARHQRNIALLYNKKEQSVVKTFKDILYHTGTQGAQYIELKKNDVYFSL